MAKDFIVEGSPEWESICERCGICCLVKFIDNDGNVFLTNVRCDFLDKDTHECTCYATDFKSRTNGCVKCTDFNGVALTRFFINNDYGVPSFCPYAQKFCTNDAIKTAPRTCPKIDWEKTVPETQVAGESMCDHIIPNSNKYFKYNPQVNEKIREAMMLLR